MSGEDSEQFNGLLHNLQFTTPDRFCLDIRPASNLFVDRFCYENPVRIRQRFYSRSDVDSVTIQVPLSVFNITDMDTHPDRNSPISWKALVAPGKHGLDLDSTSDRPQSTRKLDEEHVPNGLHLSPVVAGEEWSQKLPVFFQEVERERLVLSGQGGIAHNVRVHYCRESPV